MAVLVEKRILCVGLACLDINSFVRGYPAEDSDNRSEGQSWTLGGNAANSCTVLTQLQKSTGSTAPTFLGVLAEDFTLEIVRSELNAVNVPSLHCPVRSGQRLPVSIGFVNLENGSRTIVHTPNDMVELMHEEFVQFVNRGETGDNPGPCSTGLIGKLDDFSIIHFEGRNLDEMKKMITYVDDWNRQHSATGLVISVELEKARPRMEELIPGADILFISKTFAASRGYSDMESAVCGMLKTHCSASKPRLLVVCAWAEKGACGGYYEMDSGRFDVQSSSSYPPHVIVDTLGAGDTFIAGFLHYFNSGKTVAECLEFGCRLAGGKCGVKGLKSLLPIIEYIKLH